MEEKIQALGKRLKELIEKTGLSKGEFAEKAEISQSLISNIISGKNGPSKATLNLICRTYDVNINWLRDGVNPMFTTERSEYDDLKLKPDEVELLNTYDRLFTETKVEVRKYAKEKLELQELKKKNEGDIQANRRADTSKSTV